MDTGMPLYGEDADGNITNATDNGDGTYTIGNTTYSMDDNSVLYTTDADGNIIVTGADKTGGEGGGGDVVDTVDNGDGTTTVTYADGSTETTDMNGDVVDSTEATTTGDNTTGDENYFTDADGNVYDSDGNLIQYADGTSVDDTSATDVAYTDEYGNTYDADGNLIAEADHSNWVSEPDEYGNTYDWNGNLVAEGDHSGFTQQDAEGNTYDYDGNLIAYADGSSPDDTVVASDDTTSEDDNVDTGKRGGLFHAAKGGVPHFDSGGFTYGNPSTAKQYQANGQLTAADPTKLQAFLDQIPASDSSASEDPIAENDNGDGTVSQFFSDGSSITYDNTGSVLEVTDPTASNDSSSNSDTQGGSDNYMPDGAVDNGDGTFTLGNQVFSMDTGNPLYTINDNGDIISVEPSAQSGYVDNGDGTYTLNGTTYSVDTDMPLYRDNSKGGVDLATDNGDGTYTIGNTTYDMATNKPVYEERGGTTYDMSGKPLWTTDSAGNIISPNVTSSGGSGGTNTEKTQTIKDKINQTKEDAAQTKAENDFLSKLTGSLGGYGGSALAGAVLGGLLGNADLFGGGSNSTNQVDMSTVGKINPRTTDFGIGPANYVGYDQYGTPEAMPELYGNELYQNLNAPGFNEVNPGDYARMDAQMAGDYYDPQNDPANYDDSGNYYDPNNEETTEVAPDDENAESMAEGGQPQGGLSNMQTYYTFGTPVDPLQNLYNPQPAPQQPQQPPQGMPPQAAQNQQQMAMSQPVQALPPGMPQGAPQGQNMGLAKPPMPQQNPMQTGPQGLKSGGLPAWSQVPVTAGRLNFRDGAPVHGPGDGQSDDIPAMLADGEYVIDADTVAQIGNGSTKAGAAALDKFRENIRAHKRSAPVHKIPPKTKALTSYLRGAK
jgi:hypothetical protein